MARFILAAALALVLPSRPVLAQSVGTAPPASLSTPDFVAQAALTNLLEIAAGETAEREEIDPP